MRRFLDVNNPIMRVLTMIFDLMILSVLWIVFSIPVITMGAASVAVYTSAYRYIRKDEDYLWHSFWTAFKENFKRSTLAWLVALGIFALLVLDALVFRGMLIRGETFGWVYYVVLVLILLVMTWTIYLAAYGARFQGTTRDVLRFSFMLFRAHPVKMLVVLAIVIACIALALTLPAMVIFIPATAFYGASFPIESVFYQHLRPEDRERIQKENEA